MEIKVLFAEIREDINWAQENLSKDRIITYLNTRINSLEKLYESLEKTEKSKV